MKLLIADDSNLLRESIKKLLSTITCIDCIIESNSVLSTMNQIEAESPDVILLDIQMPDGTGMDVLKFLVRKKPKPLTIILTNYANENNKRYCLDCGADYFFDKSTEYENVLAILKTYSLCH